MPIYEYVCDKCGKLNDVLQKVNDPPPEQCSGCGAKGTLKKIVSRSSFVLRGGGWYADLYSSTKKDGTIKPPESGKADSKSAEPKAAEGGTSKKTESASADTSPGSSSAGSKS